MMSVVPDAMMKTTDGATAGEAGVATEVGRNGEIAAGAGRAISTGRRDTNAGSAPEIAREIVLGIAQNAMNDGAPQILNTRGD